MATTVRTIGTGGDHSTFNSWETTTDYDLVTATTIEQGELIDVVSQANNNVMQGTSGDTDASYYRILTYEGTNRWDPIAGTGGGVECTGNYKNALVVKEKYARIIGILVRNSVSGTSGNGYVANPGSTEGQNILFDGCTFDGMTRSDCYVNENATGPITVQNCIAMSQNTDSSKQGFWDDTAVANKFYNCTAYGALGNGFDMTYSNPVLTNCISMGNGTDFALAGNTITYCLSEDTTATGTGSHASETLADVLTDAANDDFTIVDGSNAWDGGTDLSGTFTTSLDGTTRSGTWDIGAYDSSSTPAALAPGEFLRRSEHLPAPNPLLRM